MNILFIVNAKEGINSGLFIATHNRIKYLNENFDVNIQVYSIDKYKGSLIGLPPRYNRASKQLSNKYFLYEDIQYNMLYYKDTLLKKVARKLGMDFYLKKLIKNISGLSNFDLVAAHWAHPPGSLAYYLKREYKIPFSLTLHGSDVHTMPHGSMGYKTFVKRNLNNADSVFFVSNNLREQAKTFNTNANSYVSQNAIDSNLFSRLSELEVEEFKEEKKIKGKVVGFVGDLKKIKRADWLINIFEEIQLNCKTKITFLIIGEGNLKKQIMEESKGSDIDVRIIGRVDQSRLENYYNAMDCIILPSRKEGLGNVILEAQACGTPVVATNTGGISEVIDNNNHLVINQDEKIITEFSSKVNKILKNGYENRKDSLTWTEVVKKEMEVFKGMI